MLHDVTEKLADKSGSEKILEIIKLKEKAEKVFSDAVIKEGKAEHERSHLLESYGALFLALQNLEKNLKAQDTQMKKLIGTVSQPSR